MASTSDKSASSKGRNEDPPASQLLTATSSGSSEKRAESEGSMSWSSYSYQVILIGAGFLADAYDLFVIDMVISILHRLHPEGMHPHDKSVVASATLVGAIVGQIFFGLLGDWLGRRETFVATCFLIIGGAVLSGCVVWTEGSFSIAYQLALCRFVLGIGVGGEYPLAASIAAEGSSTAGRGRMIAAVFSMQGWGMLLSCLLVLALLALDTPLEYIWRIALIAGAVPSALIVVLRSGMEETEMFKEVQQKTTDKSFASHWRTMKRYAGEYWRPLVGTTLTWLLLDVTFYGIGSFKHRISTIVMDPNAGYTDREQVWHEAVFATICCCMAIPGYLLSIAFLDVLGRYNVQFWGFIAMAVNFFAVSVLSGMDLQRNGQILLVVCFGLTFLFSNFGPNTTTFVLPVEIYPTLVRATFHGISAAAGKLGAVIGTATFSPAEQAFGLPAVLAGCAVVCLTGAVVTFFFTSDKVVDLRSLDDEHVPLSKMEAARS